MKWLSNIFKKGTKTMTQQQIPQNAGQQPQQPPSQRKFDIVVFDSDQDGMEVQKTQTVQNGVFATSANELKMLYRRCGQNIKILREYEEVSPGKFKLVNGQGGAPTQAQQAGQQSYQDMLTMEEAQRMGIKLLPVEMPKTPPPPIGAPQPQEIRAEMHPKQQHAVQEKPRYFSIGGIECKQVGEQIYQKQWVRADSKNYRLISDSNNKELPLTGKHIETLKWVLVENEDQQLQDAEEEFNNE